MTSPKNSTMNPARRAFLSKAASVTAGSAAMAVAATMTGPAIAMSSGPDPIFAAIEHHKAAFAAFVAAIDHHARLEQELPKELRKSSIDAMETVIVETDDPRWIEAERAVDQRGDAEINAACILVSVQPTTITGLVTLLRYAMEHDKDGEAWPGDLESDDCARRRSWHYFLIANVAKTLAELMGAA